MPLATGADPFVGREREMTELTAALDRAMAGSGQMVMLVGEPGIGKTRTAEQIASIAQDRNAEVLWGRCPEVRGAPPYWPWVQIIRSYSERQDPEMIRAELGTGAAVIAEVVVDLHEILPDLPAPPVTDDPEAARFRLFDAITSFLKRVSQKEPLVLILDNLHWSDEASLRLLEFVAQELPEMRLLIVGTYRDVDVARGHPLYRTLGDLTRQRLFSRVLLRGLEDEDVGRFIAAHVDVPVPASLVEKIYVQTEGNPLFVSEMVRLLAAEGQLQADTLAESDRWSIRLPEGIRETIGRRLDRLSEEANEMLTMAAVIGRQIELSQLAAIDEVRSEDELLALLEEALEAHVIDELPGGPGRFEFTHALIQQTLAEELSATRTVRMHARIASALEKLRDDHADAHAEELLEHFMQAETVLGTDPIIHYAIVAGLRALEAIDPASAAGYFESGIEAFGQQEPDERLAHLVGGLGRAQVSTLERKELQTAIDNVTRAFNLYLELGRTEAAIQVAMTPMLSVHGPTGRADLIERALEIVDDETAEWARLMAEFGLWASHERADYEMAKDALSRAMAFAERTGDLLLQLRIHNNAVPVHSWNINDQEMFNSAQAAVQLSEHLDDPSSAVQPHFHLGWLYIFRGDLSSAGRHAEACTAAAERTRNVFHQTSAMGLNAMVASCTGEWDKARSYIEAGLAVSPTERRLLFWLAQMELRLGNFEAGTARLSLLATSGDSAAGLLSSGSLFVYGVIQGAPFNIPVETEGANRDLLAAGEAEPLSKQGALMTLEYLAHARAERELAIEVCKNPLFSTPSGFGPPSEELTARVEWIAGYHERAEAHFEHALAFYTRAGYRPLWAETGRYFAESLIERGSAADRAKAAQLVRDAMPAAEELGMKPLSSKLQLLHDTVADVSNEYPDGLSEREVEVLRLIAAGRSNQKIADQLFLSRYTVVRHVSNIFGKIDTSNRAEAAIYAERHGLTGDESP